MKHFLFAVACIALLSTAACKVNYDKTKSGMVYRIVSSKGGDSVKAGQFVKFNVEFKLMPKDSTLNTTFGKFPGYGRIDTGKNVEYSFFEIMPKCRVGDSVEFSMSIDSLKARKMIRDYDSIFTRNGQIKGRFTIVKTFATEELVKADYDAETTSYKDKEVAALQDYINKKGIKAQKTKNGVFVEIDKAGDPAVKADSGKMALIMYKGYLQDGGKVFDTNMDTTKGHTDPLQVVVGQGRVIAGWDEALPYFTKGSKGKMYVPSMLAYGMRGGGGEIPPYANLIFDIEVRDVKDAPAEQPQQGNPMNNLTPEQLKQLQEQMQQQQQHQQQQGGSQAPSAPPAQK